MIEEDSDNMPEECLREMKVTICNIAHTIDSTFSLGNIICCQSLTEAIKGNSLCAQVC